MDRDKKKCDDTFCPWCLSKLTSWKHYPYTMEQIKGRLTATRSQVEYQHAKGRLTACLVAGKIEHKVNRSKFRDAYGLTYLEIFEAGIPWDQIRQLHKAGKLGQVLKEKNII